MSTIVTIQTHTESVKSTTLMLNVTTEIYIVIISK